MGLIAADNRIAGGEQRSAAWFQARIGKLTASRMSDAIDCKKNGEDGAKRKALMMEIVAERLTDIIVPHYVSKVMEWGIQYEPHAKEFYTKTTGRKVVECGSFDHPTIEYLAASPDGLIESDGLIEIKCPTSQTHLGWLLQSDCPDDYKPQMLIQLACTRKKWVDFVSFDPRMPEAQKMRIWRFNPKPCEIKAMEEKAIDFLTQVEDLFERVSTTRPF